MDICFKAGEAAKVSLGCAARYCIFIIKLNAPSSECCFATVLVEQQLFHSILNIYISIEVFQ